jgi:hypothetical protein
MLRWFFVIALLSPSCAYGEQFIFRDSDCKVMGHEGARVKAFEGDESEYTCVAIKQATESKEIRIGEATCHYKNLESGKSQGEPTKFEIIALKNVEIWSSAETHNVKMLVDIEGGTYQYGSTTIVADRGVMISKQCVGRVVGHLP